MLRLRSHSSLTSSAKSAQCCHNTDRPEALRGGACSVRFVARGLYCLLGRDLPHEWRHEEHLLWYCRLAQRWREEAGGHRCRESHELVQAAEDFERLGIDVTARVKADKGMKAMKVLLVKVALVAAGKPTFLDQGNLGANIADINAMIQVAKRHSVESSRDELAQLIEEKLLDSSGASEGGCWYDGLAADATLVGLLDHARCTLMRILVAGISDSLKTSAELSSACKAFEGMYAEPLDANLVASASSLETKMKVLMTEGLLAEAFRNERPDNGPATLKGKAVSIRKLVKDTVWDKVQPILIARATAALRLRRA